MSEIIVTFEGMLVLFVNNNRNCNVGILDKAPGHEAELVVVKHSQAGDQEIARLDDDDFEPQLWLDVQKAHPSVQLMIDQAVDPFVRVPSGNNQNDFRWALDFEGREMYKRRIRTELSGFGSILQINDGLFFTQKFSLNQLTKMKRGTAPQTIGQVATQLAAKITLSETERADLWNGSEDDRPLAEFPNLANVNYEIYLAKKRHHDHDMNVVDAENYYSALGKDIAPSQKLHFGSDRPVEKRIDPDARCLIGWMSQTEL